MIWIVDNGGKSTVVRLFRCPHYVTYVGNKYYFVLPWPVSVRAAVGYWRPSFGRPLMPHILSLRLFVCLAASLVLCRLLVTPEPNFRVGVLGSGHFPWIFHLGHNPADIPPPGQYPSLFTWCRTFPPTTTTMRQFLLSDLPLTKLMAVRVRNMG